MEETPKYKFREWKNPTFKKPTFKKFFSNEELEDIANSAKTTVTWDFNTACGDTIKEKYESMYVKLVELTNILLRKGAVGYFWIVASPEVGSVFETAAAGFWPVSSEEYKRTTDENGADSVRIGVSPLGLRGGSSYRGSVNNKWRLYVNPDMPTELVIIGCNDTREDNSHYGELKILNFII